MKEHPIIFSTDMVKAILDGRKTQTRRILKVKGVNIHDKKWLEAKYNPEYNHCFINDGIRETWGVDCPYGQVGDRLWVRETWQDYCPIWQGAWCGHGTKEGIIKEHQPVYKADSPKLWLRNGQPPLKWKPSIHMPRWASRITLEITEVRVERVQEITERDAISEGIEYLKPSMSCYTNRYLFNQLWDSINAKRGSWESNLWVWVIGFKVVN